MRACACACARVRAHGSQIYLCLYTMISPNTCDCQDGPQRCNPKDHIVKETRFAKALTLGVSLLRDSPPLGPPPGSAVVGAQGVQLRPAEDDHEGADLPGRARCRPGRQTLHRVTGTWPRLGLLLTVHKVAVHPGLSSGPFFFCSYNVAYTCKVRSCFRCMCSLVPLLLWYMWIDRLGGGKGLIQV